MWQTITQVEGGIIDIISVLWHRWISKILREKCSQPSSHVLIVPYVQYLETVNNYIKTAICGYPERVQREIRNKCPMTLCFHDGHVELGKVVSALQYDFPCTI